MESVSGNVTLKNKDNFTQNLSAFRKEVHINFTLVKIKNKNPGGNHTERRLNWSWCDEREQLRARIRRQHDRLNMDIYYWKWENLDDLYGPQACTFLFSRLFLNHHNHSSPFTAHQAFSPIIRESETIALNFNIFT